VAEITTTTTTTTTINAVEIDREVALVLVITTTAVPTTTTTIAQEVVETTATVPEIAIAKEIAARVIATITAATTTTVGTTTMLITTTNMTRSGRFDSTLASIPPPAKLPAKAEEIRAKGVTAAITDVQTVGIADVTTITTTQRMKSPAISLQASVPSILLTAAAITKGEVAVSS